MAIVKAFNCNFVTMKGEDRNMTFVRVADLPASFIAANTKGGVRPALKEGFETVWSIGEGWRTLNVNTARDVTEMTASL
jgi:hypothetical protein